jgi:hypothetical protein
MEYDEDFINEVVGPIVAAIRSIAHGGMTPGGLEGKNQEPGGTWK